MFLLRIYGTLNKILLYAKRSVTLCDPVRKLYLLEYLQISEVQAVKWDSDLCTLMPATLGPWYTR